MLALTTTVLEERIMAKEILSGIYKIENLVNGKCYIGSAVNFTNRESVHRRGLNKGSHHSQKLQRAWDKYGPSSFVFMLVEIVEQSENLIACEQRWIDALQPEYNISMVAGSCLGVKRRDETKQRLSNALKGKSTSVETKKALLAANIGRKQSVEHVAKRAAILTGKRHSAESIQKMSELQRSRTLTEQQISRQDEIIKMMASINRGRPLTDEHKQKIASSNTGKRRTEESKTRMRGKKKSAETLAKMIGRKHSAESILKMSQAHRLRRERKEFSVLV